ncbi:MAG: hypothetical protein A2V88_13100 [Elusimicrobia bacterium RBG_16_66_12]|nr:MAG: hypothetical protein A2V88_13100 [Elusimicrobia bacterium RBG_16_66_12]
MTGVVSWLTMDNGALTLRVQGSDGVGGVATADVPVTVSNVAPTVSMVGPASGSVHPVGQQVLFTGWFTDLGSADTHTAQWSFDGIRSVTPTLP